MPSLYEPRRLCMECRTLLGDERCDADPRHRVLDLDGDELLEAIWPPGAARRRPPLGAIAGGLGGVAGALLGGWPFAAAGAAIGWIAGRVARRRLGDRHEGKRPRSAIHRPRFPHPADDALGRVVDATPGTFGGLPEAAAHAVTLQLSARLGGGVSMRHAWCFGLTVETEAGGRVRVPPGRIRLDVHRRDRVAMSRDAMNRVVSSAHPRPPMDVGGMGHRDPLPCDAGWYALVHEGDRVALLSRAVPVDAGRALGYREDARTDRVAVGVPVLHLACAPRGTSAQPR